MTKIHLFISIIIISGSQLKSQNLINKNLLGQNAWAIDNNDPSGFPASNFLDLNNNWKLLKESGITQIRLGGIDANWIPLYDFHPTLFTVSIAQVKKLRNLIDSARAYGIEPIIEVGFAPPGTCANSILSGVSRSNAAKIAGNLVDVLNNNIYAGNKIEKWTICNEPDLGLQCTPSFKGFNYNNDSQFHADSIAKYTIAFATAMKDKDPSIKIVGPELATFGTDVFYGVNKIMNKLVSTSATNGIMGTITSTGASNGLFVVDYLTVHAYPTLNTRQKVIDNPRDPINGFEGMLSANTPGARKGLIPMITANAPLRNASNLSIGLTEYNLGKADTTLHEDTNLPGVIQGKDFRSFLGSQWTAQMLAVGMNSPYVGLMNYWSIREGGIDPCKDGFGYISACNNLNRKRPTFHVMKMMSHFNGNFYYGQAVNNPSKVKTFAGVEAGAGFHILVLNMDSTTTYNTTELRFNNTTGTGALNLSFNFSGVLSAPVTTSYIDNTPILARSTVLYEFDCHGTFVTRIDYTEQMAIMDQGPALRKIGGAVVDANTFAANSNTIGGTLNTNTVFANDTVYVNNDLNITGNTTVTFLNSLVIVAPGKKIKTNPNCNLVIKNSIIAGVNGSSWAGIECKSNYHAGIALLIDKSILLNADNAVSTDKVSEVQISQSIIASANGQKAVSMDRGKRFVVNDNLFLGFSVAISTSRTQPNFISKITNNQFLGIKRVIDMVDDQFNNLEIACNFFKGFDDGMVSKNTILNDQGTALLSTGNVFYQSGIQKDYIKMIGSSPKYYYSASQSAQFTLPGIVNIPIIQASSDRICAQTFASNCQPLINPVGIKETPIDNSGIIIYPNPSSGTFNLIASSLKGNYTLNIHDVLGRIIMTKKLNIDTDKTLSFEIISKGLYFVTLENKENRITQKIIVE